MTLEDGGHELVILQVTRKSMHCICCQMWERHSLQAYQWGGQSAYLLKYTIMLRLSTFAESRNTTGCSRDSELVDSRKSWRISEWPWDARATAPRVSLALVHLHSGHPRDMTVPPGPPADFNACPGSPAYRPCWFCSFQFFWCGPSGSYRTLLLLQFLYMPKT